MSTFFFKCAGRGYHTTLQTVLLFRTRKRVCYSPTRSAGVPTETPFALRSAAQKQPPHPGAASRTPARYTLDASHASSKCGRTGRRVWLLSRRRRVPFMISNKNTAPPYNLAPSAQTYRENSRFETALYNAPFARALGPKQVKRVSSFPSV